MRCTILRNIHQHYSELRS